MMKAQKGRLLQGKCIKQDDIIIMIFDRKNKTLQFKGNDIEICTMTDVYFKEKDTINMIISLRGCDCSINTMIKLSNFEIFK